MALVAFALLSVPPNDSARFRALPKPGDDPVGVSHNAKGLELQYRPFLDAFESGNSAQAHQAFVIFSLPNPADWFARYFAKEQVEQLGGENDAELNMYERVLMRGLGAVPPGTKFRVHCKPPHADPTSRISPGPDAIVPALQIPVEQFVTEFESIPKMKFGQFSMLVNYVYLDGAFRYVGKGAYPFWTMPDSSQKK